MKKIKKIIAVFAIIPAVFLSSCGKMKEPAPNEITSAIQTEITVPSAVEKDASSIEAYYDINTADIEAMSLFICGSGAYPDELAVFKMNTEESAKSASDAVQNRLDSQIELYRDYTPDEFYKLEEANVTVKGKYVMLFVCENDSRAREIADALF